MVELVLAAHRAAIAAGVLLVELVLAAHRAAIAAIVLVAVVLLVELVLADPPR